MRQLFQLRRKPAWQVCPQSFRGRSVSLPRMLVGLLLNFFDSTSRFIRNLRAAGSEFLLPLFKREISFGGDGLRSGLPSSRFNLVPCGCDLASFLAGQMERNVGCACRSGE